MCPEPVLVKMIIRTIKRRRKKTFSVVLTPFICKCDLLSRQARDKHRESTQKMAFSYLATKQPVGAVSPVIITVRTSPARKASIAEYVSACEKTASF